MKAICINAKGINNFINTHYQFEFHEFRQFKIYQCKKVSRGPFTTDNEYLIEDEIYLRHKGMFTIKPTILSEHAFKKFFVKTMK